MAFNRHGSFYIRASWPLKGVMAIIDEPTIFTPQKEFDAIDKLGIGRVMVTSLRYWMKALKLATEDKDNVGRIELRPTHICRSILEYDKFFQNIGTAWLLHRNLAKNYDDATTWYWFFNKFEKTTFTKEEFISDLKTYTLIQGMKVSNSSLNRDFNCLKNTYEKENVNSICEYIEEGIVSYFSKLDLIRAEGANTYRKQRVASNHLPSEIVMYAILDDLDLENEYQNQISIDNLFKNDGSIGKVFNLSYSLLIDKLEELEKKGYIKIFSRFGHNHIEIIEKDKDIVLKSYYRKGI